MKAVQLRSFPTHAASCFCDSLRGWGTQISGYVAGNPRSQNRDLGHPGSWSAEVTGPLVIVNDRR